MILDSILGEVMKKDPSHNITWGEVAELIKSAQQTIPQLTGKPVVNLSKREIEIMTCMCREMTTAEIATELSISVRTVEAQRASLVKKLGVKTWAGIVVYAIQHDYFKIN